MAGTLVEGMLVHLASTQTDAQLLSVGAEGVWEALSFDGESITVSSSSLLPFTLERMPANIDLVIGPKSDRNVVLTSMIDELSTKGYCASLRLLPKSDVTEMYEVAKSLQYSRVPLDFEPYYLGRESREKTALLDFSDRDLRDNIRRSPLLLQDTYMSDICDAMAQELLEKLGISFTNRTNLLVRQTFQDDEEEDAFPAPEEPTHSEQEGFMGLMKRKRVCVMQFLGPEVGTLSLIPKVGGEEIDIAAAPGTMLIFLTERFHYSHSCESGTALTLQCWFLSNAPQFALEDIGGDLDVLVGRGEPGAPQPSGELVMVTGTGASLAASCSDLNSLWLAFNKAGADGFVEMPITRFDRHEYCLHTTIQEAQAAGKSYTKHQGFVDGIELFDSSFFSVSPAEAKSMDPNQRKCLEVVYLTMYDAGYTLKHLKSNTENVGCFVGISGSEWSMTPHAQDKGGCGGHEAIISNRCNFVFNFKGTSFTVNTACSASLVAIHAGKLHLKYKDFDPLVASVAGGVQLSYNPLVFAGCCSGGMLSYIGRCFTFDSTADGYGRGEGVGFVCMQLQSFEKEYACLAGSQTNQDGRSASITAPNGPSQEKCIRAAFRETQRLPQEVDCFECHGTGTALGDPIEVGAFRRIYTAAPRPVPLGVTTTKTNFGHAEGAAGVTGFLKCVLQVTKCECSPNLHLKNFNPHIDVAGFPAQFTTEGIAMRNDSAYCGVSSFGFGGTNGHVIAYGENRGTSRKAIVDSRRVVMERIESAEPTKKIHKPSLDPEEWESSGMPISSLVKPKLFQVEINNEGQTIWREVVPEPPAVLGKIFHISGTFNDWGLLPLREDPEIPGLFCADMTIGDSAEELFHIVVDRMADVLIYPAEPMCIYKTAAIRGPDTPDGGDFKECTWRICASAGTRFNIQFFRTATTKTITWLKLR